MQSIRSFSALLLAVTVSLMFSGCSSKPPENKEQGVKLILNTTQLDPTTTFELRFDVPMVKPSEVGRPALTSPLKLNPPIAGSWMWLSSRSGVFTPSEALALGRLYHLTLQNGLKDLQGAALKAELSHTIATPDLRVVNQYPQGEPSTDSSSLPEVILHFNAEVDPSRVQGAAEFRSAAGKRIAARAQTLTIGYSVADYYQYQPACQPWDWRFKAHSRSESITYREPNADQRYPVPNAVTIKPAQPLPPGEGWALTVRKGVAEKQGKARLNEELTIPIGNIRPFAVNDILARNGIKDGKYMEVIFNKQIDPTVQPELLREKIRISPEPADLRVSNQGYKVRFDGAFSLSQAYTVKVPSGLSSKDGLKLADEETKKVGFAALPPRLYFPGFAEQQQQRGGRQFELLAMNVPEVRLRAKRLTADNIIHALRGYEAYRTSDNKRGSLEPHQELAFDLMAGTMLYDKVLPTDSAKIDEARRLTLSWDEIIGKGKAGAVFLEAERTGSSTRLGTQALLQVTDLGLYWKDNKKEAWVFVFSLTTGQPLPGVTVSFINNENQLLQKAVTDADGSARLALSDNKAWLLAQNGDDLHAVRYQNDGMTLPAYSFNFSVDTWSNPGTRSERKLFFFTERPVYRPGENIYLKGILRDWFDSKLSIPRLDVATLTAFDSRERRIWTQEVPVSAQGTLNATIPLPEVGTGSCRIVANVQGNEYSHYVSVEEYKPNDFEVTFDTPERIAPGDKVALPVTCAYYTGKPLSKARLRWSLNTFNQAFEPSGMEGFQFGSEVDNVLLGDSGISGSEQGETPLGPDGKAVLTPEIAFNTRAPSPRGVYLSAEVTDLNQQTISQSLNFIRDSSTFYLGLKRSEDVVREGDSIPLDCVAVKADETPMDPGVEVKATLRRIEWRTIAKKGAGGSIFYENEPVFHPAGEATLQTAKLVKTGILWDLAEVKKDKTASLTIPEAGQYLLELRAKDEAGRDVVTARTLYASGKKEMAWDYRDASRLQLVPDKAEYQIGETATLLVKSPLKGKAIVTIERERVMRSFVADLTGNAPSISIPLFAEDAPNVMVGVTLLRGAEQSTKQFREPEYRFGYCQLRVSNPTTKFTAEISIDKEKVQPREKVSISALIRDASGKVAPGAEVAFYAVDEGVLSLMGYQTPDPLAYFHAIRPLRVSTCLSLLRLFRENPEAARFDNKGYLVGDGGDEGGGIRKNFAACAFWSAGMTADVNGKVFATFAAPDSLTRYRVIAVVNAGADRFGSAESSFEVSKPLMLLPVPPRFARVGDQVVARAVINSLTNDAGDVEVTLDSGDGKPLSGKVKLAAKGTAAVDWPVTFTQIQPVTWKWSARFVSGNSFTDAVESKLIVQPVAPLLVETYLGRTEARETNLLTSANPQLLEGEGTMSVTLSNSRLVDVDEAVSRLLHYPYGCVEQTSSALLPWLALGDFVEMLPALGKGRQDVEKAVRHGISRLLTMQTDSGGLAYWPGGREPHFWGSAYGGFSMAWAKRNGYEVPEGYLDRLCEYLREGLKNSSALNNDYELSARCLALYTLALQGTPEASYHEMIFNKRELLSAESRSLLALAIFEAAGPQEMITALLNPKEPMEPGGYFWFGNAAREIATRLLAWSRLKPEAPEVDTLITELLQERKNGHWETTQGNAWAMLALAEYVTRVEGRPTAAAGALNWKGQSNAFALKDVAELFQQQFKIAGGNSTEALALFNPQMKKLYTQVKLESRSQVASQPRQDRGFSLQREYQKVLEDGSLKPATSLQVGDRILVTLRIESRQPAAYVAIEDPLPALLEAMNPNFKSQQSSAPTDTGGTFWPDHTELREDRVLYFSDYLQAGRHEIRYLARVRAAGKATAPSAKIEEMYHPERVGLTESQTLEARPLN